MDIFRNDIAVRSLGKALDGLSLREQVIGNNVANVDTPNFKASEVSFERDLQAALSRPEGLRMATTDAGHFGGVSPVSVDDVRATAVPILNTQIRNDGSNVDIDREMAMLAETQISFQAATQLFNDKLREYRLAIWEGKK